MYREPIGILQSAPPFLVMSRGRVLLLRSPFPRVVLCGASALNGFLRGKASQVRVSAFEAWRILEQVAPVCSRCLDQLETAASALGTAKDVAKTVGKDVGGSRSSSLRFVRSVQGSSFLFLVVVYVACVRGIDSSHRGGCGGAFCVYVSFSSCT